MLLVVVVEEGQAGEGVGGGADGRGRRGEARGGAEGRAVEQVDREGEGQVVEPPGGPVRVLADGLPDLAACCDAELGILVVRVLARA